MTRTPAIFKTDVSRALYEKLFTAVRRIGPHDVELKKTCVHACRGRAFLGVHPRATGVLLSIVTDAPIKSERLRKCEQLSARRWHAQLLVESPKELDAELKRWIAEAYALCE